MTFLHRNVQIVILLSLAFLPGSLAFANQVPSKPLQKTLDDYIGLYAKDTLDQWKKLFHPSVTVFFPSDEGGITVRNLDEFFQRQQNYFSKRKSISERLENLQVFEGRRIARVVADFIFVDEGEERAGKLGIHLVEENKEWKIVSVLFSYNNP